MKKTLLFFLICSLFLSCSKDDVPNEDWKEKDNIFRCKINGTNWEPEGDGLGFTGGNLDVYYENFFNNAIQFRATKDNDSENDFMSIFFFVGNSLKGEHDILNNQIFTDYNCGNYYRDTLSENIIDIDCIDSFNKLIEGTFSFTASEGSTSTCTTDTIVVTDGYFKVKYRN